MTSRIAILVATALVPLAAAAPSAPTRAESSNAQRQVYENGIVRVKSAYPFAETVERLKGDVGSVQSSRR
jgi:hypothetical protein